MRLNEGFSFVVKPRPKKRADLRVAPPRSALAHDELRTKKGLEVTRAARKLGNQLAAPIDYLFPVYCLVSVAVACVFHKPVTRKDRVCRRVRAEIASNRPL